MITYMIPTNAELVELIAKAICRDRMLGEITQLIEESLCGLSSDDISDVKFTAEFERLWGGILPVDDMVRQSYMSDAINSINTINMYLLSIAK